jgi:outer membrane protein assembly factor BamB
MKNSKFVYIGIRGSVVALDRASGQQVWATRLKGYDFVNLMVLDDAILATSYGEIYCLNQLSGKTLWHNPLKGYGTGLAAIATANNPGNGSAAMAAQKNLRDQQASAAAATTAAA